ncbi:MAG TPA: putative quinol monooxygenase [Acidobacteriaceae bacterium]|nr:putative quinol monooxygenase [Acidobacteriaceae bacterium]
MVSFTVRMEFEAEDREAVAEMLHCLGAASREEPGCVNYIAHFVEGEPAMVLIYEQYVDEAAVEFHRTTPHFQQHANALYKMMRSRSIEQLDAVD